jgi:phospholipid transport system transporter-binding protein
VLNFANNTLCLVGAVVIDSARGLFEEGRGYCVANDVTVDFSGVTELDSSAIALILEYRRAAESAGRRLTVSNSPASLQSLATLYGVTDLIAATP